LIEDFIAENAEEEGERVASSLCVLCVGNAVAALYVLCGFSSKFLHD
jgi:hypothetical protein